jgi:hypothetical protein
MCKLALQTIVIMLKEFDIFIEREMKLTKIDDEAETYNYKLDNKEITDLHKFIFKFK